MTKPTGNRRGSKPGERRGGRQKGTKNKKTVLRQQLFGEILTDGITPLEYMLKVLRTPLPNKGPVEMRIAMVNARMDAAKAAAPYVHPRVIPQPPTVGDPEENAKKIRQFMRGIEDTSDMPPESAKDKA